MVFYIKLVYRLIVIGIITSLISISLSNGDLIEANLKFNSGGNGFHRIITYQISIGQFTRNDCYIALNLNIPSALYVNIDELADLQRLENNTACSIGETDAELFAEDAKPQQFTVCTRFINGINILSFKLHQRYQRARNNENYVNVTLPHPTVLLGCKERIKEYPTSKMDICESCAKLTYKWREIPYKMTAEPHTWMIPVGELSQRSYVTWITLFACAVGTIFIAKSLW